MKAPAAVTFSAALMIAIAVGSLTMGRYPVDLPTLLAFLSWDLFGIGSPPENAGMLATIIYEIRLPRILAALLVGAALAVSGGAFQAMFVNPLVSPGILGVLAGSAFGAALGIILSESWAVVQILSFSFGIAAVGVAVGIAAIYRNSGGKTILLVLGGVISGALFGAILSIVKYTGDRLLADGIVRQRRASDDHRPFTGNGDRDPHALPFGQTSQPPEPRG